MKKTTTTYLTAALLTLAGLTLTTGCANSHASSAARREAKLAKAEQAYYEGVGAEATGDTAAATRSYKRALSANGEHTGALRRLATIYTADDNFGQALPLWKRLVEATDGDANAYNDLGYTYDLSGFADPAEAAYARGVQQDPANARVRTNFGLMLARHGRTNEALIQLRAAMPEADAYYNVGVILEAQGKKARAKREFQRAIDADPSHVDAELHLATIDFNE
jgi:Tfp pilus assembly protein PilF